MDDEQMREIYQRMMNTQKKAIKNYYLKNKKEICDYSKSYYERHKEDILIKRRERYQMKKNQKTQ